MSVNGLRPATAQTTATLTAAQPNRPQLLEAHEIGPRPAQAQMKAAITLPLRNQAELDDLGRRLYDPADPLYGKYLTPAQFTARFGPTQADFDAVVAFAQSRGLKVEERSSGRTMLLVSGSTSAVEAAFAVTIKNYQLPNGRIAYANTDSPRLPFDILNKISGVVGLDNLEQQHSHITRQHALPSQAFPNVIGSGQAGGLSPQDIKNAYNLDTVPQNGTGQVVALVELDGYVARDIDIYTQQYALPNANLENILVGGYSGAAGPGSDEVVLDIEMILALAPMAKVLVYEAPNTAPEFLALIDRITRDGRATVISDSWGLAETQVPSAERLQENDIFQEMSVQGQSMYAAAGDNGAYDDDKNPTVLTVDNPASQPFVTGVGGTTLHVTKPGGVWSSETTWNGGSRDLGAGGGGVSTVWPKPKYQEKLGVSKTQRDVPDVSLNADNNSGYSIYLTDPVSGVASFQVAGGTSAAAPLWAAFTALVNEKRGAQNQNVLGYVNPQIYAIGNGLTYSNDFHDINNNSTNLFYHATPGYDDATGWGSFFGVNLLNDLSPAPGGADGTLQGTVLDDNGNPVNVFDPAAKQLVGGVTITAYIGTSTIALKSTTTSITGKYSLTLPSGESFTIRVTAAGFAGLTAANLSVPAGGTVNEDFTLITGHQFNTTGVQMISAPYDYSAIGDFAFVMGFSPPTIADPVLVAWQANVDRYVKSPAAPADTFRLGQGYWVRFPNPVYVHSQGASAPIDTPFRFRLQQGWNQIGDPFLVPVDISTIQVDKLIPDVPDAPILIGDVAQTLVQKVLWSFDTAAYAAHNYPYVRNDTTGTLQPWQGYWIFATSPAVLVIPSGQSGPPGPPPGPLNH